jgi:hypothetical protein
MEIIVLWAFSALTDIPVPWYIWMVGVLCMLTRR